MSEPDPGATTGRLGPPRGSPGRPGDHGDRPGAAAAGQTDAAAGDAAAGDGGAGVEPESATLRIRRAVLLLAAVLVVYYAAPVGELPSGAGIVLSVVGVLSGVVMLAWQIVRQVQRLLRADPADGSVRIDSLVFLVYVMVPMFALGYFALERSDGDQFEGLATKTDALYYTLSTLATVGFGDVHAAGQLARALVAVQIVFNLVFVAMLASVVTSHIRGRAASRRQG